MIEGLKLELEDIKDHTSWNSRPKYTPAQMEVLVLHIDECHKILRELTETNAYEFPYRCPVLITRALDLLGKAA